MSSTATPDIKMSESTPPRLRHALGSMVTPGERLGNALVRSGSAVNVLIPGKGTYLRLGNLYSSLLGTLYAEPDTSAPESDLNRSESRWIISVKLEQKRTFSPSSYSSKVTNICPGMGDIILGRITRVVRPSYAMVDIIAMIPEQTQSSEPQVMDATQPFIQPLHEPFSGILRQNEIRPNSSLEIEISDCVRPSDLILARVHALGEKDYILTTAEAELGVIQATCESSGKEMKAVSWKEMECVVTGAKEGRKVAKPRRVLRKEG